MTSLPIRLAEARAPRYTSYPTVPHFSAAVEGAAYRDWLAALPAEIKDVALTVSARLDQDGVAATRGPDDLVGSVYTTPSSAPAAIALEPRGVVSNFMK